ncbi:tetratricopeptide repeat protein [Gluconacetobacter sacchari]|uniref:tetratricopeptide repeat protein n=1 Tax=Gluconacetobacter sacchari TaxID=92759 RepID=UPI0039B3B89A
MTETGTMDDMVAGAEQGAPPGDLARCKDSLLRSPTPDTLIRICDQLVGDGRFADALRLILEVTSLRLDDWKLSLAGATVILRYSACYDIVETLLRNVLRCSPDNVPAQSFLAHIRMAAGDIAGGCGLFADMTRRYPAERANICEFISMSLLEVGYPEEALKILRSHLQGGEVTAALLNNLACALERLNRSAEALPWYERALALDRSKPEISFGYSCTLLKAGRLREGWELYVGRKLIVDDETAWFMSLPRLRHGDDVAGRKVLLFSEQGLGDTIQFIRLVPFLLERGAEVTVLVPRTLVRLLAQSFPGVSVHDKKGFGEKTGYSYAAPIPDLPYIAGVMSVRDIPDTVPYLRADDGDVARWAALMPVARPRVGLVWAGDRRTQSEHVMADKRRSTTLADMGAALTPADVTLVNLQFGRPRAEIATWEGQALFDPMDGVRDMADTAAIMKNLDLVISVDTAPLHLAGAVGCPVWLISRWDACWRWGDVGDSSPWYPNMRVFRARERSFAPVLQEVGRALRNWI